MDWKDVLQFSPAYLAIWHWLRMRYTTRRFVGIWYHHEFKTRNICQSSYPLSGPTTVEFQTGLKAFFEPGVLTFVCWEQDQNGNPTRYQRGHITVNLRDPKSATRRGKYDDSDEWYSQDLHLMEGDKVIQIFPDAQSAKKYGYAPHAWKKLG